MLKRALTSLAAYPLTLTVAHAQDFPLWELLLSHYGGKSDQTPMPSMKMGSHMQMSLQSAHMDPPAEAQNPLPRGP